MTTDNNYSLPIDLDRSISLEDAGLPGYGACVLLGVDGEEVLALIYGSTVDADDDGPCVPLSWKDTAPHELTGRLPRAYAPKCGHRASTSGKACQNVVSQYGQRCPWHRSRDEQDTARRAARVRS